MSLRFKWHNGMCEMIWRDYFNRFHVASICTHPAWRRQGLAKKLMQQLCDLADHRMVSVTLCVMPYDSTERCMNHEQLYAWYGSFGFHQMDDEGMMRREPMRPPVAPELVWTPVTSHDWIS